MKEEISLAEKLNIDVTYLSENLTAKTLMRDVLENRWNGT